MNCETLPPSSVGTVLYPVTVSAVRTVLQLSTSRFGAFCNLWCKLQRGQKRECPRQFVGPRLLQNVLSGGAKPIFKPFPTMYLLPPFLSLSPPNFPRCTFGLFLFSLALLLSEDGGRKKRRRRREKPSSLLPPLIARLPPFHPVPLSFSPAPMPFPPFPSLSIAFDNIIAAPFPPLPLSRGRNRRPNEREGGRNREEEEPPGHWKRKRGGGVPSDLFCSFFRRRRLGCSLSSVSFPPPRPSSPLTPIIK